MKSKYYIIAILIVLASIFFYGLKHSSKLGGTVNGYPIQVITTGSLNLTTGTSTVVSLPDSARAYGYICNTDTAANEFLGFSQYTSTATSTSAAIGYATTTAGVVIFPKTCYEISSKGNMFWGQINATTASSATTSLFYMFGK